MTAETAGALLSQLASIDTAIAKAEAAQSMGSDGTNLQNAALDVLYKRRDIIQRRYEQAVAMSDPTTGGNKLFGRTRVTGLGNNYP